MDFQPRYSPEMEAFRKEVRTWVDEHQPVLLEPSAAGPEDITEEEFRAGWEFRKKLGAKGWLAPTFPKEYGGGGLSKDEALVINEELNRHPYPVPYDRGISLMSPAVLVWGSEEQKQAILPRVLTGQQLTWQLMSEPEAGSDLAAIKTTAVREGDEYVINGTKLWVGSTYQVDYFYLFAVTDSAAPRHANMGAFYLRTDLPGIAISPLDLVCHHKNQVFFDNVRVPVTSLIGGELDGWRVAQTTLEVEHGASGMSGNRAGPVQQLIDYCKTTTRNGKPLSKDLRARQLLTQLYIEAQVGRLFATRNSWMLGSGTPFAYEGPQHFLHNKIFEPRLARATLEIAGPYAMTSDSQWAPQKGRFEVQQRYSLSTHAGGTPEIQKLIMARRLGIGRPRQAAAVVPKI